MSQGDFTSVRWCRSSASNDDGNCVEVARVGKVYGVRDSKNPSGPVLRFTAGEFTRFVRGVRAGEFG